MADFLDEAFPEPQAEAPDPVAPTPEPEQVAEPVQPEPPQPEVQPQPVATEKPEPGYVPLAVVLDTRDKLRQAEAELAQYRQQQASQAEAPDPYDDPKGYARFIEERVEQRETALRFEFSDRFARQAHGEEAVKAATEWAQGRAQSDPVFAASYMRESDPIGWIVQQHKRDALLSDIGDVSKLDDWFSREAAKRGYVTQSASPMAAPVQPVVAPQQSASAPAVPPRSIASDITAPTAARSDNPMAELDAIFNKR